jgi:hypothetical protein
VGLFELPPRFRQVGIDILQAGDHGGDLAYPRKPDRFFIVAAALASGGGESVMFVLESLRQCSGPFDVDDGHRCGRGGRGHRFVSSCSALIPAAYGLGGVHGLSSAAVSRSEGLAESRRACSASSAR